MAQYHFAAQSNFYQGKVRDVYTINDKFLVMVASDRISAFDVVLPKPIPHKGQVLNQVAAYMLRATEDICPNWLLATPAPHVSLGKKCTAFALEIVVRGHLTGHAWRTYSAGGRELCGVPLPNGMNENEAFPSPIITPSTKASHGHDEDISAEEIIKQGLATFPEWEKLSSFALQLFERGKQMAAKRGLILVDTKYEFGKIDDEVILMDEIHTPDSSRYFYADGFEERLLLNQKQKQLSKEFVREWLIENNFMGKPGQEVPEMNTDWVKTISSRYIELYEILVGEKFVPALQSEEEVHKAILVALETLNS